MMRLLLPWATNLKAICHFEMTLHTSLVAQKPLSNHLHLICDPEPIDTKP